MKEFKKLYASELFISLGCLFFGGTLYSIGLHFFVASIGAYAGGVTGLSQVFVQFISQFNIFIPLGGITILFNIPILIFGWFYVEKRFVVLSFVSVIYIGICLSFFEKIPAPLLFDEIIFQMIFGGLLLGLGTGITLRYGASTGGMDIISAYLSSKTGKSFGGYSIAINVIIACFAYLLNPLNVPIVLITILQFFYVSLVVNQIHTKHKRFTMLIVTKEPHVLSEQIHIRCGRGATLLSGIGSYSKKNVDIVMVVVSSYQIYIVKNIILRYDPTAFVNVLATKEVFGNFAKNVSENPIK